MISCCDLLIAEHRRTETLLDSLAKWFQASSTPDWAKGLRLYQVLANDLQRHFALEEQALFALLSPYRTMMLMEVEHDDLLALQAQFQQQLVKSTEAGQAQDELLSSFNAFQERLKAHILEEERGIFPLAMQKLPPEEQNEALRLYHELLKRLETESLPLYRPQPTFTLGKTRLTEPVSSPMGYETLYDRQHTSIQHLQLQAGQKQALHWVGPHQWVVVITGKVRLTTQQDSVILSTGESVTLDSRLYFAFEALQDTHLLTFKVWPHPHYTKA